MRLSFFLLRRWTRREEADFYRVVSTFGVVFDPELGRFDWTKFRAMARLHKKTDESLHKYLCAFTAMCRRVCRLPPREGGESEAHTSVWPTCIHAFSSYSGVCMQSLTVDHLSAMQNMSARDAFIASKYSF